MVAVLTLLVYLTVSRLHIFKVIPDDLAVLHHESNALKFCNVRDRIFCHSNKVSKFPRLDCAHSTRYQTRRTGVIADLWKT